MTSISQINEENLNRFSEAQGDLAAGKYHRAEAELFKLLVPPIHESVQGATSTQPESDIFGLLDEIDEDSLNSWSQLKAKIELAKLYLGTTNKKKGENHPGACLLTAVFTANPVDSLDHSRAPVLLEASLLLARHYLDSGEFKKVLEVVEYAQRVSSAANIASLSCRLILGYFRDAAEFQQLKELNPNAPACTAKLQDLKLKIWELADLQTNRKIHLLTYEQAQIYLAKADLFWIAFGLGRDLYDLITSGDRFNEFEKVFIVATGCADWTDMLFGNRSWPLRPGSRTPELVFNSFKDYVLGGAKQALELAIYHQEQEYGSFNPVLIRTAEKLKLAYDELNSDRDTDREDETQLKEWLNKISRLRNDP